MQIGYVGSLAGNMDAAELALGAFCLFFVGLIRYLQRESNREGFPLLDDKGRQMDTIGLCGIPPVKTFKLPHNHVAYAPRPPRQQPPLSGVAREAFPGAPREPTGNKLLSNMGPASWAARADEPDAQFYDGTPRIVPLRADKAFSLATEDDPNPIGYAVAGKDDVVVGTVVEAWVDRSEGIVRFFETKLAPAFGGRTILVPGTFVDIQNKKQRIVTFTLLGAQLKDVPGTKKPDVVTLLEEDKIYGYFGGGTLYATPELAEPFL